MAETQSKSSFQFVDWSDVAGPTKNAATRVLIRKQAMSKAALARRERGDWGKKNITRKKPETMLPVQAVPERPLRLSENSDPNSGLASPPLSMSSSNDDEADVVDRSLTADNDDGKSKLQLSICQTAISPKMACTGYELLRMESDFDILDLSALSTFHVGRITTTTLHTSPLLLSQVLQCRQWSYLTYVPGRFGHFPCLDDAIRCTASRVRLWIKGETSVNAATLSLYTKALDSLQNAINDPVQRLMPETLCATELLAIYELLDKTRSQGWVQHAAGAKSLLRMRGPQRFNTTFDRALFMAQIGPIYTESIIDNTDCFLEEPEWQCVLNSIVDEQPVTISPFSDRGIVVISLWNLVLFLPNLWRDVQSAVCCCQPATASEIQILRRRVTNLVMKVSEWRSQHEPLLRSLPDPSSEEAKEEKRFETLGMCLVCLFILKRLSVALDPLSPSALNIESEVTSIAEDTLELEKTAVAHNPRAGVFMMFKSVAARATLATTDDWRISSVVDARMATNGLIAKWVFENWCRMKGRSV